MMNEVDPKSYFSLSMRRDDKSVNVDFQGEDLTLSQVLEEVLNFMKACGYCFEIDDYLDVVNDFKDESGVPYIVNSQYGSDPVGDPVGGTGELDFSGYNTQSFVSTASLYSVDQPDYPSWSIDFSANRSVKPQD